MRLSLLICLVGYVGISGCSDFPQLDQSISQNSLDAPYPEFVQLDGKSDPDIANSGPPVGDLNARLARLNRRADALRGPVLSRRDRERLQNSRNRLTN